MRRCRLHQECNIHTLAQVKHSFDGLIHTIPGLNLNLLKMDTYEMDMEKDPLFRGEFEVVKELLEKYPAMAVAKNQADKLIDLNGPKSTGGTGIKQLRENIAESKLSYEIMDDAAQVEDFLYLIYNFILSSLISVLNSATTSFLIAYEMAST